MNNNLKQLNELYKNYNFKDLVYKDNPFLRLLNKFQFKNNKLYYVDKIILEIE